MRWVLNSLLFVVIICIFSSNIQIKNQLVSSLSIWNWNLFFSFLLNNDSVMKYGINIDNASVPERASLSVYDRRIKSRRRIKRKGTTNASSTANNPIEFWPVSSTLSPTLRVLSVLTTSMIFSSISEAVQALLAWQVLQAETCMICTWTLLLSMRVIIPVCSIFWLIL